MAESNGNGSHNGNGTNGNGLHAETPMQPGLNGGQLKVGNPGNKGGGQSPQILRMRMRYALARKLKVAEEIAGDETATKRERLQAIELLARYGLGTTVTETDTEGRDMIRVVREPRRLQGID